MYQSEYLHGWKAIAGYVGVTEKTARKYFAENGLPVRKIGGRYRAQPAALDEWLRLRPVKSEPDEADHQDIHTPGPTAFWRQRSKLGPSLALVALTTALLAAVLSWKNSASPAIAEMRDHHLEAFDADRNILWSIPFPDVDAPSATPATAPLVRDVDGDGRPEVLFNYHPIPDRQEAGRLICFSDKGEERWSFTYAYDLTVGDRPFVPLYFGQHLRWLEAGGEYFVLIVIRHDTYYPARLVLLEPSTGDIRGEYWHPGYIEALTLFDSDQDGVDELLAGGVNNPGSGSGRPSLAVLDVPFGEPISDRANFFGEANALERDYLLFPRVDYLHEQGHMEVVTKLLVNDNRLTVTVRSENRGQLQYILNRDLSLHQIHLSDTLVQNHDAFYRHGEFDHKFDLRELTSWRVVRRFLTAPNGNSAENQAGFAAELRSMQGNSVKIGRTR